MSCERGARDPWLTLPCFSDMIAILVAISNSADRLCPYVEAWRDNELPADSMDWIRRRR